MEHQEHKAGTSSVWFWSFGQARPPSHIITSSPDGQGCGPGANVEFSHQNKGNLFPLVLFNCFFSPPQDTIEVYPRVRLSFSWIWKQIVKYLAGSGHEIPHSEMSSGSCSRLKCLESLGSEETVTGNSWMHTRLSLSEQKRSYVIYARVLMNGEYCF